MPDPEKVFTNTPRTPTHCCCHPSSAVQPCELEGLMSRLDEEFKFYGVTLKDLVAKGWACSAAAG
jgi:hypothetical protein